jgi:hypothetical protein
MIWALAPATYGINKNVMNERLGTPDKTLILGMQFHR